MIVMFFIDPSAIPSRADVYYPMEHASRAKLPLTACHESRFFTRGLEHDNLPQAGVAVAGGAVGSEEIKWRAAIEDDAAVPQTGDVHVGAQRQNVTRHRADTGDRPGAGDAIPGAAAP